jgi:bleomycin hydrolase
MTTFAEPKAHPLHRSGPANESGSITPELLGSLRRDFQSKPAYTLAQNAVTQVTVDDVALNRSVITSTDHTFSHVLDDWTCTNQKKSGRCWCFAGLNLFRVGAMKKMNLKDFEFSQNYTLFWDKFERANYFLEAIIETAVGERDVDDRTVAFLLDKPLEDGGQWNMFVNIVKKHGLVPKAAMPESQSSSDTQKMNGVLLHKLRDGAKTLRELRGRGAPMEALRAAKQEILKAIYRILCIHLGTPPAKFDWQWNDKDKAFHRDGEMTPQEFAANYIELKLDEYVCVVHDPRKSSPVNRTFTVEYLGNVVGGDRVVYLNVDINVMKDIAKRTIMDGEPVWFGCDVGKMMRRDLGVWDKDLFDFQTLYDTTFNLSKADRLTYHQTLMTHAMVFTGVDVVHDRARRWRVENSWGDENTGKKGFFVMNDSWFDEYMFEIAAKKSLLPPELIKALEQEPIVLPAWDPMGALAH